MDGAKAAPVLDARHICTNAQRDGKIEWCASISMFMFTFAAISLKGFHFFSLALVALLRHQQ